MITAYYDDDDDDYYDYDYANHWRVPIVLYFETSMIQHYQKYKNSGEIYSSRQI